MSNSSIDKYLEDLKFIDNIKLEIEKCFLDRTLDSVKLINILIESIDNLIYYKLKSLNLLENYIFELIKKYNNKVDESISIYLNFFNDIFENMKAEIINLYDINIYFYGNDNLGLIENNLLKYNVKKINNKVIV